MFRRNHRLVQLAAQCALEALEHRFLLSYDSRGKISVIVDNTRAEAISAELAQYKQDLVADGWIVSMHTNAPRMNDDLNVWDNRDPEHAAPVESTTPQYRQHLQDVKDMIAADAADETLKAVVIVGHVTVPYSGYTSYDNHGSRAMPTDQYYADLDGTWSDSSSTTVNSGDFFVPGYEFTPNKADDGRFDQNAAPGNGVELSFGRIDMANMTSDGLQSAFESDEVALLQNYFARDHAYRNATFRPLNKALVQDDGFNWNAPNFDDIFGTQNVVSDTWLHDFSTNSTDYLFASRTGGGGTPDGFKWNNETQHLLGYDFGHGHVYGSGLAAHATFMMAGGSFFGDWNNRRLWTWGDVPTANAPFPRALVGSDTTDSRGLVAMSMDELESNPASNGLVRSDVLQGQTTGEGFRETLNSGDHSRVPGISGRSDTEVAVREAR
jgi:hypothetical protein